MDTLAGLEAEFQGALHLTFRVVELLGCAEAGELDESGERLLRILTPLAKLTTARQAMAVTSECLEAFGGVGYVEDTGLPTLLRDAQVLTIWEGTTNVLALDTLRALGGNKGIELLRDEIECCAAEYRPAGHVNPIDTARDTVDHAAAWLEEVGWPEPQRQARLEAGARRFALTLGRTLELALLAKHAQWSLPNDPHRVGGPGQDADFAALRLAAHGANRIIPWIPGGCQ